MLRLLGVVVLVLLLSIPSQAQPAAQDLVINEILYAPDPSTNEFIEVLNRSDQSVDLSACTYADGNLDFDPIAATETQLEAGRFAVLVRDPSAFEAVFPEVDALAPPGWEGLNNGGDRVAIRCNGETIDAVEYDASWGGSDGASLERIDPAGASTDPANFGTSAAEAGATPGARNSLFAPDTTAPVLEQAFATPAADSVVAVFSEVLAAGLSADRFRLEPASAPAIRSVALDPVDASRARIALQAPLAAGTYTLIATGITDPSGNRRTEDRALFSVVRPASPARGDVVINEVLYAPDGDASEFLELFNRSDKTFALRQFTLSDARDSPVPLPDGALPFAPGTFAVLVADAEAFATQFPDRAAEAAPIEVSPWPALNNSGDTPVLRADDAVVDAVPYTPAWGGADGRSLERIDPAGPSNSATNFATSSAAAGATPGAQNSRYAPDTAPPAPRFAQQIGPSTASVRFDEPLAAASVTPSAFMLDGTAPQTVRLTDARTVQLEVTGSLVSRTVEMQGLSDLTGNVLALASLPLALQPAPGDVVVNEILFDPLADAFDARPDQPEYVELFNLSGRLLTLHRAFLTDRPTERGTADTTVLAKRVALPPNGFAVVFADREAGTHPAETSTLVRAFPDIDFRRDDVALLPVDASSLRLNNDGDAVRVHRADGTMLDTVRYSPDWHAEALRETKGTSLERISATGAAQVPDNWTSSAAEAGGTPGRANAISIRPAPDAPAEALTISPSPFSIERDGGARIRFATNAVPSLVRCRIFDAMGRPVRTLDEARLTGRTGELIWNGRDDNNRRLRMGVYIVLVEAVSAETGAVSRMKAPVVLAQPME